MATAAPQAGSKSRGPGRSCGPSCSSHGFYAAHSADGRARRAGDGARDTGDRAAKEALFTKYFLLFSVELLQKTLNARFSLTEYPASTIT